MWSDRKLKRVTARVIERKDEVAAAEPGARGGRGENAPGAEAAPLGMTVRQLTQDQRRDMGTDGSLVVEEVSGAAEAGGVRPGDVILGVGGRPVRSLAELQSVIKSFDRRILPLLVQRANQQRYLRIPIED